MGGFKCKSCGEFLKFHWEIDNSLLCSNCGPGSLKWQAEEEKAKGQAMREQIRLAVDAEREHLEKKVRDEMEAARSLFKDQIRAEVAAEERAKLGKEMS